MSKMHTIRLRELAHLLKIQWMQDLEGFGPYGNKRRVLCI